MSTEDRDYESCPTEEEHGDQVDDEKRKKEEEDNKKAKERQIFLGNLYVLICMIIIVAMAVAVVIIKINLFHEDPDISFIPLNQQVSRIRLDLLQRCQVLRSERVQPGEFG